VRLVHALGTSVSGVGVLGARGDRLSRLKRLDLPIAPGFAVATTAWRLTRLPGAADVGATLQAQTSAALAALELESGHRIDDAQRPLLLSITPSGRDGADRAAPIRDVGLSDATVEGLAARAGAGFAWGAYRDLLYAVCLRVHGLDAAAVDRAAPAGASAADQVDGLKGLLRACGRAWPERGRDQLAAILTALIEAADEPTALVVQTRTIGAVDERSGAGTVLTREPETGKAVPVGRFRPGGDWGRPDAPFAPEMDLDELRRHIPGADDDLRRGLAGIEAIQRDMCEVDFTIERGRLWFDDARPGRRSALAAVRIATDLVAAGLIDVDTARLRVPPSALEDLRRMKSPTSERALARVLSWSGA